MDTHILHISIKLRAWDTCTDKFVTLNAIEFKIRQYTFPLCWEYPPFHGFVNVSVTIDGFKQVYKVGKKSICDSKLKMFLLSFNNS